MEAATKQKSLPVKFTSPIADRFREVILNGE
jgi:hypothetical protein